MYKIQSQDIVSSEILLQYSDIKKRIITEMLVEFAKKMYELDCFEMTEEVDRLNSTFKIESYILTPKEFKKIIELFKFIKCYTDIPESLNGYIVDLYKIFTKELNMYRLIN